MRSVIFVIPAIIPIGYDNKTKLKFKPESYYKHLQGIFE